jgi:hypothetical protein
VTGSGFTAKYIVWPNVYTESVTSIASNIAYRAWGARKSMTYGNTTSEQTTYNTRLQPATYTLNNMNYQNTNTCCPYPIYSTMAWTFDYYNDGRIKTAWDSSNDWFDRAYKYDHAGRLKEASTYRRARGLSPLAQKPDPYFQNITYDAFNHTSRTGLLYTGELSDVGTWVNNRRTGPGWQYHADGNTTIDPNFSHTFDVTGKPSHSASFAKVGDGINYPYQPSTDITQTYDGTGAPGKRIQITRQPDGDGPPLEDTETTYYVRSTVLGAAVVELNSPASDIVNIYAGGQRIARGESENITFEHTNPLTGTRVTSAGYSTYRWTLRQERDSFGAEIPTSNPYPLAQSYADYKFGEPLYILGGDPFDYSTGREIDGLPVSETEFQRRVGNGNAGVGVFRGGKYVGFIDLSRRASATHLTFIFDLFRSGQKTTRPDFWYWEGIHAIEIELPGPQQTEQQRTSPERLTKTQVDTLEKNLHKFLADSDCGEFIKAMLQFLPSEVGFTTKFGGSLTGIFDRIKNGGGFWSGDVISERGVAKTDPNTTTMTWDNERSTPFITGAQWRQFGITVQLIHELTHVFTTTSNMGAYAHLQMAQAASAAALSRNMNLSRELKLQFPSRTEFETAEAYDLALEDYFGRAVSYACRKVKL